VERIAAIPASDQESGLPKKQRRTAKRNFVSGGQEVKQGAGA